MSLQSGPIIAGGTEFYKYSQYPQHELGAKMSASGGRTFRYVKAGATALVAGKMQQGPATDTNEQNLTPTAATNIGDTSISVTTGAAVAANAFAGGWAIITTSTGVGYAYEIDWHAATTGAAALTIYLKDPIQVATATTSRVDLVANPYNGVVLCVSTPTATPVGVAVSVIPATYYGWVQSGGPCAVLADGTIVVGNMVVCSNATSGAVEAGADATDTQCAVGYGMEAISTTEYGLIFLTLDT